MCTLIRYTIYESLVKIADISVVATDDDDRQKTHNRQHTDFQNYRQISKITDRQTTDRIPKLPTERHFLELSKTCLYMANLGLVPYFRKLQKQ